MVNQKIVDLFPGEYAFVDILENANLIKLGHNYILIRNELNKYKHSQLDPQYKITSSLSDIQSLLPTLYESIDELVSGSHKNVPLSSRNIYDAYNENISLDEAVYDEDSEL
eukprot:199596_1